MVDQSLVEPSGDSYERSLLLASGLVFTPPDLELPWETLGAIIQGKSAIDLTAMPVYSRDEACSLLHHYGFDLNHPEDAAEVEELFVEAVNFIEHRFLTRAIDWEQHREPPSPAEKIPASITRPRNAPDLIILASQRDNPLRPWACALLKVMHTLVYIRNSPLYKYHGYASETILSRFRSVLFPEADGTVILQGAQGRCLRLYGFEEKRHKPRESILIKLLCKKENVAEHVWDLVGVRLITFHPAEAILAVDILREEKVILFPNIIPSRSRNTLIDFDQCRALYETSLKDFLLGQASQESLRDFFRTTSQNIPKAAHQSENPLSSPEYRSLHITCRQLLRVQSEGALAETRFAFPYEIQIFDKINYFESRIGLGAHAHYKQRQLFAARRRVLGSLLTHSHQPENS